MKITLFVVAVNCVRLSEATETKGSQSCVTKVIISMMSNILSTILEASEAPSQLFWKKETIAGVEATDDCQSVPLLYFFVLLKYTA